MNNITKTDKINNDGTITRTIVITQSITKEMYEMELQVKQEQITRLPLEISDLQEKIAEVNNKVLSTEDNTDININ
jgi:hypothetical protein